MPVDELRALIARHTASETRRAVIPGVTLARVDSAHEHSEVTVGTVFALVAQGSKRLSVGDAVHEYGAGQYLVTSMELPVSGRFLGASPHEPALGMGLVLRPEVIAELMLSPAAAALPRARDGEAPPAVAVGWASQRLRDAAVRMLRLLDSPEDIPVLAPLIEREMLWLLMSDAQGSTVRQLGMADSSLNRVRRVAGWMREQHAEPVRVDELARRARMSPSAFHRAFHSVTRMSPIQFQKSIRLHEARLHLLAQPRDVAAAAYAVGYESPSQFSREYRRQFGLSPSQDVRRLRESIASSS